MKTKPLTKSQKNKIIKVIRNDAEIRHEYINASGQTCVIGGLAKAAGMNLKLRILDQYLNDMSISTARLERFNMGLHTAYGLSKDELHELQIVNDKIPDRAKRQKALIEKVNSF